MLTVEDVLGLRLGKLASAVDDWEVTARRLHELAGGRGGAESAALLRSKAEQADWKGVNATVGKAFVVRTAAEFDDAATSARSVLAVLSDALRAFTRHRDDMTHVVDDAAGRGIRVTARGAAEPRAAQGDSVPGPAKAEGPTDEEIAAVERNAKHVLEEAEDTDRITARALRALARGKHDFSGTEVKGLDHADNLQGRQDADRWAEEIAKGDVANWSDGKLRRFNETLAAQKDNPAFAERFATALGADGTLRFWRDLANQPDTWGLVDDDARGKLLGRTQDDLSTALATATWGDGPGMEAWKKDMIAAGGREVPASVPGGATPYGFAVMSSLMRKGTYDTAFLQEYGDGLLKFEREAPPFDSVNPMGRLVHPPGDDPADPVAWFMESLGHNPDASLEFLHSGPRAKDHFDYLVGHGDGSRTAGLETVASLTGGGGAARDFYETSLGHALESAATGNPYDSGAPSKPHSAASADFVHHLVDHYGSHPDHLDDSKLRGSLGNITADYMRDFQDGMNGPRGLTTHGTNADLGSLHGSTLKNFLGAVGKDPDAYGAILHAQQSITTELVDETLRNPHSLPRAAVNADVNNMVAPGAEIAGIMAESRTQAIYDDRIASDEEFNKGITTTDKWAGRVIDLGANHVPVVGDVVSWIAEDARGAVVEHYTRDSTAVGQRERNDFLQDQLKSSSRAVYGATYQAALEEGYTPAEAETLATSAQRDTRLHYGFGSQSESGT
ncbi:hypothetical protein [Streptomyces silvensis]|uniref:AG2 protein n=1 Tax=Streptomyces silvensis TaxID=1765722 RepID=A0A0W7WR26_9ACTN|nr:hypothetical protein [Streptomyces silvensis]KUF13037.1 hypothetical protein AT728_37505 [Streptomyces silvensis]